MVVAPHIAIVMPVHNALSYTKKAIVELSAQISGYILKSQIQFIVVDDGSSDGTSEWISSHHPEIFLIHGDGNLWWSGSVNLGVKFALSELKVDFILLWNNDCTTTTDYFRNLIQNIAKLNDNQIIIASKVYYQDKPNIIFNMGASFEPRTGNATLIARDKLDSSDYEKELKVDWTGGMGVLIHREVFDRVGYFNEIDFPQYYGDCDFYLSAKKKGISVIVYPNLKVWNDRGNTAIDNYDNLFKSFKQLVSVKSRYNLLIDLKFFMRHSHMPHGFLSLFLKYLRFFGRIVKFKLKILNIFK